jgi:hypothetical protein
MPDNGLEVALWHLSDIQPLTQQPTRRRPGQTASVERAGQLWADATMPDFDRSPEHAAPETGLREASEALLKPAQSLLGHRLFSTRLHHLHRLSETAPRLFVSNQLASTKNAGHLRSKVHPGRALYASRPEQLRRAAADRTHRARRADGVS